MLQLHKKETPITKEQMAFPEVQRVFENLQGNILRPHGRHHAVHIFLKFRPDKIKDAKKGIQQIAEVLTSAQQQHQEANEYRRFGIPGKIFCSFFLSIKGYRAFGIDFPEDPAFRAGMQNRMSILDDLPCAEWEEGYQKDIHAMLLLADNDESTLLREARHHLTAIKAFSEVCTIEYGRVIRNEDNHHIEHFGYVDGRSQPLFFATDVEMEKKLSTEGSKKVTIKPDPSAGPSLVLVPDYNGGKYAFGSYLVFRKLKQNILGFVNRVEELAEALDPKGYIDNKEKAMAHAGALVVGRFQDGTPVVRSDTPLRATPIPNDFTFTDDPDGQKCPFHAHIRKVNQREVADDLKIHRIVRRGIPYGKRELGQIPSEEVGLLFMCYQRDIRKQFEHLQAAWANNEKFPASSSFVGIDPLIGQGSIPGPQQWPTNRGKHSFQFNGFVTLKGGEYFFAPSISFLKKIYKSPR